MNYILYNNQFFPESDLHLSVNNRGFLYGDGIFETMIIKNNILRNFSDHIERFSSGLKALHLGPIGKSNKELLQQIFELKKRNRIEGDARIKLIVWRKSGGLFSAESEEGEYIISAQKHTETNTIKSKVVFASDIKRVYSSISTYKTLSSLPYVMAAYEKKQKGADDIILLDTEGNISECLVSNIFWMKGKTLYTPSIQTGCIKGVMRKQVLEAAEKLELEPQEGKFSKEELLNADFIFTSNAAGLDVFYKVEGKEFSKESEVYNKIRETVL